LVKVQRARSACNTHVVPLEGSRSTRDKCWVASSPVSADDIIPPPMKRREFCLKSREVKKIKCLLMRHRTNYDVHFDFLRERKLTFVLLYLKIALFSYNNIVDDGTSIFSQIINHSDPRWMIMHILNL